MSEFNLVWRRYGLEDNPYFHYPLSVEESKIPISAFVGRDKERKEIKKVIELGGDVRFMVTGEAGVGKTSLVNFVRSQASENFFFTPQKEIEINRVMTGNEFIILTLSAIYTEAKRLRIAINKELLSKLEALYELAKYGELSHDIANLAQLNRQKLMDLFNETVENIINSYENEGSIKRFNAIIIHYDNLDNIFDFEGLAEMISDVRDFLFQKRVIFIFIGDLLLPQIILHKKRVSGIFLTPSLELKPLGFREIYKILNERLNYFKIKNVDLTPPHTEQAVETLFRLHNGNIRDILNSLTSCVISLPHSNTPIQITDDILRETLYKKVNEKIISKLRKNEREILNLILKKEYITPTEIAKTIGQKIQNVSSYYLNRLKEIEAIKERGREGRNVFYEVTPIVKWLGLKDNDENVIKRTIERGNIIQKLINDFR